MEKETIVTFLDTETTGLDPKYNEIIDIWARRCKIIYDDIFTFFPVSIHLIDEGGGKIKPEHPERISDVAKKLNGYNREDWKDAEDFYSVYARIHPLFKDSVIVGSQPAFDISFINENLPDKAKLSTRHIVDLASFSHILMVQGLLDSASMSKSSDYFKVPPEEVHTAFSGVAQTEIVYERFLNLFLLRERNL